MNLSYNLSSELCTPYMPATPVSIPSRRSQIQLQTPDTISDLLERTRIPRKFNKTKRKPARSSTSSGSFPSSPERGLPLRRSSLFDYEPFTPSNSLPSSHSFLLTPPKSIPDLSRSCSTNSLESEFSTSSSQHHKSPRLSLPSRTEIDLDSDNPLDQSLDEVFDLDNDPGSPLASSPTRRKSSLGMLLRPFKTVDPSSMVSSMVSSLSANLSSWAASLASSQLDDNLGLLPLVTGQHSAAPVAMFGRGCLSQALPRPIKLSGPQKAHATIMDAEMERPLLLQEERPVSVELALWPSSAPVSPYAAPEARGREPRMNPDFLRILVLESNMRKLGKISDTTGRARMILSPRSAEHCESRLRYSSSI